jgi:uncharacterized protein
MLKSSLVRIVDACTRYPWWVIAFALALAALSGVYTARHFALKTNINELISRDVPWVKRAAAYMKAFPDRPILAVVDAPTPELSEQATNALAQALRAHPERFRAVTQPASGEFFQHNGLLFLRVDEVKRVADGLTEAKDLIGTLAGDPSLRGTMDALTLGIMGVQRGKLKLDDMVRPMTMAADTARAVLEGTPASFSWRSLAMGKPPEPGALHGFIAIDPVLDFSALQPGRAATDLIGQTAAELHLDQQYQARVRLTGLIPIDDDEFGTLTQNLALNTSLTLAAVLLILWAALRSGRIIFAVVVSLFTGLAISAACGLLLVGALNPISIAFFVLFIGLGVDFGIQFSVRYRAERYDYPDLRTALTSSAKKAGGPLALAAVATAVGFSSFTPTAYLGLSELGQIAGTGMIVAFITSVTLLPALLAVLNPPGELHPMGFSWLAPADRFLERHRVPIVVSTVLIVALASPLLFFLPFDFNPLHLRSPKVDSVATMLELKKDPRTGANAIDLMAPNLPAADHLAERLSRLPEVSRATTLGTLVPEDQDQKLTLIRTAAAAIDPALNPKEPEAPPTDQDNIDALSGTADLLMKTAGTDQGPGAAAALRLSGLLARLAAAEASVRSRAETVVVEPLRFSLAELRNKLNPEPISPETIPPELAREWVAPDGRSRVQVLPSGDPEDTEVLRKFATAVLAAAPDATGPAVMLFEAGRTIKRAFIEAGLFALCAISLLLWITLRRIGDVLLTLVPLLVAGVVTLELCVVLDLPLNFANILALPLLLGVGVAFKIYYIMAWRSGKTALLQSSLTRAVVFSAMTTATAFGSLWLSSHPGTSSMGKLMALALLCTMAAAVLFQPALMGPPRRPS